MASFFGEIVPQISRAVDDDDDDEGLEYVPKWSLSLKWETEFEARLQADPTYCFDSSLLVFAVGPAAAAFVKVFMLTAESSLIGKVEVENEDTADDDDLIMMGQSSKANSCVQCEIHQLKSAAFIVCENDILPELAYEMTEKCLSRFNLKNSQVVLLTSSTISQYRTDVSPDELQVPFMRVLKTDAEKNKVVCPLLEQPNTIAGLTAQVLTYCQLRDIAASLYISYTDVIHLDARTVKTFKKLSLTTQLKGFVNDSHDADQQLSTLVHSKTRNNDLYL